MSRTALSRLVVMAGAAIIAVLVLRGGPRDVELVYDVSRVAGARTLEVEIRQGADVVRRAALAVPAAGRIRHAVKLSDGDYRLDWRLDPPGGPVTGRRSLEIREGGTIVLPLGP